MRKIWVCGKDLIPLKNKMANFNCSTCRCSSEEHIYLRSYYWLLHPVHVHSDVLHHRLGPGWYRRKNHIDILPCNQTHEHSKQHLIIRALDLRSSNFIFRALALHLNYFIFRVLALHSSNFMFKALALHSNNFMFRALALHSNNFIFRALA